MKILSSIVIYALVLLSTSEVRRVSDTVHDGLFGRVRSMREYRFFETQERPNYKSEVFKTLKGSPYLTVSYDERGDMTEQTSQYGAPKIYLYDTEGNRTVDYWYDGRDMNQSPLYPVPGRYKEEYEYDALGRPVEMSINEGPDRRRIVYTYNRQGRLAEMHLYSLWNERPLINRIVYTYYSNWTLQQERWYRADGLLIDELSYSNHEYDSRGNWIIRKQVRDQYYDKNMPTHQSYWAFREITYY